jgi:uncharacterized RDD family membrane protein YckC
MSGAHRPTVTRGGEPDGVELGEGREERHLNDARRPAALDRAVDGGAAAHLRNGHGEQHLVATRSEGHLAVMSETRSVPEMPVLVRPWSDPAAFAGVPGRRAVAFLIDAVVLSIALGLAYALVFVVGLLTLGLGFLLFGVVFPAVVLGYYAVFLGDGATPGMRAMGLAMRQYSGARPGWIVAAAHALLFYVSMTVLTPLVLLYALLDRRRRLLHDVLTDAVVIDAGVLALTERR